MFVNLEIIFNNTYGFNQFTYKVPDKYADNIQVGDIVTVPFRNTTRNAIITEVNLATSSVSNTKTLFKKIGSINRNQYKYLERLAVSNNLNIGILLDKHISYELLSKQNKVKTNNIFIKPNSDVAIYLKESYNIIFTSSLEESKQVAEHLKNNGKKVSFYQKTGGVKEFTSFWEKNKEFETIIVLSVNFERINVDDKLTFHFFNSNNISYNLPKLNNLNISFEEMFMKQHLLLAKKVKENSDIKFSFSDATELLTQQFLALRRIANETDVSFIGAVDAQHRKQIKGLENLEKRLLRAEKRKQVDFTNRIIELHNQLFPNNGLDERQRNFSEYYLQYGQGLFIALKESLKPLEQTFTILEL